MTSSDEGQGGSGLRPSVTSSRPKYSEAEREFLQQRIAVFGKVGCLLSVCFYVMVNLLTGGHPFSGRSAREVFDHHLGTEPLPPSRGLHQSIPGDLEIQILSSLAKDPRDRPQSAEVLRRRLAACEHSSAWTQPDAEAWWKEHGGATPGMPISEELATTIQGGRHAP